MPSNRFLLKDIAYQAGLSLATVDRAIHGREGVRQHTRARVEEAIRELERQSERAAIKGRRFTIDVIMETTNRFGRACREAFEAEVPSMRPASFRCRFHMAEIMDVSELVALLERIRKRGSHGVVLKGPDAPSLAAAVNDLVRADIPVVTFVSDIDRTQRLSYVGMDNQRAGETAAYFMGQMLAGRASRVLTVVSSNRFHGEAVRESGFKRAMQRLHPHLAIERVSEGHGINQQTGELVREALQRYPDIAAVYSIGGGNKAIVSAFDSLGRDCHAFIAHDLDDENLQLLRNRRITLALHHDLRRDARTACQHLLRYHRMLPADFQSAPASIDVVTPFNLPD